MFDPAIGSPSPAGAIPAVERIAPLAGPRATGVRCATPGCAADASYYRTDTGTPACPACAAQGQATGRRLDGRALVFDAQGRLLVLDQTGRGAVADATTDPLRELAEGGEPYQGPVVHWLRVDESLPLPRNLEYAGVVFPPAALRHRRMVLPRYSSLAALPSGALIAGARLRSSACAPAGPTLRRSVTFSSRS